MADPDDNKAFDPETISLLAGVMDRVWSALPSEQQTAIARAQVAEFVLTLAAQGERSPSRMYDAALAHFTQPEE
jgi:hypothetical protein